ncbi:hypothetical protein PAMP_023131 [Pampus punctatissimus]
MEGCADDQIIMTKTVGVGDDVTLTCSRQTSQYGAATFFWIRLVDGILPEFLGGTFEFDRDDDIKTSRITAKQEPGTFVLIINEAKTSDTGLYYCIKVEQLQLTFLNATFLRIKGPEPDITAVIEHFPSDPVRPGDSVTLQCSVFSDSENKRCPEEHRVLWFTSGSDESHPSFVYTYGNRSGQCENSPETRSPQKCVYSFSRNISSSDAGTYYCAVAACGEILFGNGTKVDIEDKEDDHMSDYQQESPSIESPPIVMGRLVHIKIRYCKQKKYTLIPVITVQLGEPATLTCAFSNDDLSSKIFFWYKQSVGDNLKLIVTMYKSTTPEYGPEFSPSRFKIHREKNFNNLTILRTSQEDEGTYHCTTIEWISTDWRGTYLLVKGHSEKTSNYTVVQWSTVSDPVRPGDSVTLQCSVVSESQNEMCPGETSVYWYRAGSHASHPAFIYTDGNSRDLCREKPGIHSSPKSCVYRFSKKVSSSDAGTYYCAVATCGDILFGNGTKVELGCTDHHIYDTKTVRVGEDVKLICMRDLSGTMFWIKLVSENTPQVLAITYGFEDRYSRITAKEEPGKFVLHIRNTELSDTAAYYCMKISQRKLILLNKTFLKVEGSGTYTNITAVPPSDPVPTGDSVTLQCSVLSENKTCLEEDNVYWFSARLDKTQPSFIYTQGNSGEQSQKSLDTQSLQKCVSRFSRNNVSSSDAGTYYCAVATCGETLSRNGTKLNTEDTLIPVITVQLGEPATLTCAFSNNDLSSKKLHWYKQSAGDTLKLIVKLYTSTPEYGPEFSPSRFKIHREKNFNNLTILRTSQEDEGTYHCATIEWINTEWRGTYLLVKGHSEKTSNYTVVQWPTVSDPVRPGDSVTLQCSVVSESQNEMCPGETSVYWYRAGSHASHPAFIYTDGNSRDLCREKPGIHSSPKSCVYRFSKKVSSSDAGTYYCAVATCGDILFGNGTKVELGSGTYTNITAVPPSDPVPTGDSVTLQCSVLSENKTCLEEDNVYWFSARLDKTQPSFIYTQGNSGEQSQKSLDTQSLQKCVSRFSRNNVSSSDAETYYCAVATCGETLSRNETKLNTEAINMLALQKIKTLLFLLCAALALSLIVIVLLIYSIKKIKKTSCDCCKVAFDLNTDAAASGVQCSWQTDEDSLVYSAPTFTSKKSYKSGTKDTKTSEIETIYTDVSALRLN